MNFMMEIIIICVAAAFFVGEVIMLIGGGIIMFRERYCCSRETSRYLSGEHSDVMAMCYPEWSFTPRIRNGEAKRCISRIQRPEWGRYKYFAGMLEKESVSVKMFVTVVEGHEESDGPYAEHYVPTRYYNCFIFEAKDKLDKCGGITVRPYSGLEKLTVQPFISLGQRFSDIGDRKYDMNASVSGGYVKENICSVTYGGIQRRRWQKIEESGVLSEIEELFGESCAKMHLFFSEGKLTLAVSMKMSDGEMYDGHNDLAAENPRITEYAAKVVAELAELLK